MKSLYKKLIIGLIAVFNLNGLHAQTPIPVCGQTGGFTGMTRGYYFTAPTNFTICGIFVEDNMSTAFQSAAIVRFTAGAPPAYPGTTNNFVTLWQNLNYAPNNMIPVPNVAINAGDIIGIYGSRTANSVNSYGPAQCVINIQGFPTTTFRSGMQFDLAAGPGMHDIWNENNGSIGRVTMYTNCCPMPTAIPAINGPTTICEGNTATYTVAAQPGAVSYNWTVPAGATITSGQGTTTLNVTWNTTPGGQVCVDWTDACGTSPQTCINVTVNPEPTANVPANATYCPGDPVPAANFTSNPAGATYTWTNSNTAIGLAASGNGNTPAFTATNTGTTPITGTITVTPTLNGCTGNPVTYTITVNPEPTANVPANATYCPGDPVPAGNFTSNPAGATYTWTNSNTAIGLTASGNGNTPAFTATNTGTTPITGTITVTPTLNGCTGNPVTYTITVNPEPTANVPANATYCPGDPVPAANFTSNPTGATYTWTNSNTAIGLAASGNGNTPAFNATNTGTTPITGTITVTPTLNGCTGNPVTYTITVNPTPPAPTAAGVTICPNNSATLTATAPGGNYEWYDAATGGNLLGSNASYTTPVLTNNTTYYVQTTVNGCVSPRTAVTVTIAPALVVNAGVDDTICDGVTYTLGVNPNGPGYTYSWDELPGNPGFSTIFNPSVSPNTTTTYVVTVTDQNNCVGSDSVTIYVNPIPTMTTPANITACNGDAIPASAFTSNPAGATFAWTNSDPTIGLAASGNGNTPAFTATNNGTTPVTATITVTPTANTCTGNPITYTITVNPTPTVLVPANDTVCDGATVAVANFTSTPAGGTFAWTNSDPTIGLAASGTGNVPSFTATNPGSTPVTATITVTPTANGCVGTPSSYTITVNPTPTMNTPANITVCNNDPIAASTFSSTPTGGSFSWTNSDPTIGLAASGTGNTPAFTAINSTNAPITSTITVTPTVNGCSGNPITYTITVNPGAIVTAVNNIQVCPGDMVAASNYTSLPTGGTFAWTNSDPSIGLAASGSGNTPAFNAINNGSTPIVATISVTATANGCPGPASTYTITVAPVTTGSTNVSICQGDSMLIGGNYYSSAGSYNDTLINSYGCDSILTFNLTVNPIITVNEQLTICDGDSVLINGNYYSTPGIYPFTFTSAAGCDSNVIYELIVDPLPIINIIIDDNTLDLGESTNIVAYTGQPNTSYSWSPSDGLSCVFCSNPIATPSQSGWYYVTATNSNGCTSIDSVYIEVDPTSNIYVPNIFSPNEDGQNDIYKVRGKGIDLFYLAIYNRWGQMVFESEDINRGWDGTKDGKLLNQGVFVYKLNITMKDGDIIQQTGNITLVR